jgi:uncharacterized protein YndB with AHSA1/START domain
VSQNAIHVDVPPDAVWEVVADPRLYGNWVVGAATTRRVDGRWPEPGAVLHHTQAVLIKDTTSVLESDPPRRLVLEARARPLVVAHVEITLEPEGGGTRVVLEEWPVDGLLAAVPRVLIDPGLHLRNAESVRRIKRLAEIGRHAAAEARDRAGS